MRSAARIAAAQINIDSTGSMWYGIDGSPTDTVTLSANTKNLESISGALTPNGLGSFAGGGLVVIDDQNAPHLVVFH